MNSTGENDNLTLSEMQPVALIIISSSVISILGLSLNSYVMWLILAGGRETLVSDIFSLNLAATEIFFSLSSMFYLIYANWKVMFFFDVITFSSGIFLTARPLFKSCICIECYVAVVHPVLFLRFKPLRYRVTCCSVAWLMVLASCIYSRYTYSENLCLYLFFIQNVLSLSVMFFCCLSVVRVLKRPGPGETDTERKKSNTIKRRAYKIILLIMISMTINFLLYIVTIPMQHWLNSMQFSEALTISLSLALTTGFIQPLLYIHRARKLCFKAL